MSYQPALGRRFFRRLRSIEPEFELGSLGF